MNYQRNSPRPKTKCKEPYYSQACSKSFSKFWAMSSTQSLIVSNFLKKFFHIYWKIFKIWTRFSKYKQDFPFFCVCSTESIMVEKFFNKFSIFVERFSKFEQDVQNLCIFVRSLYLFIYKSTFISLLPPIFIPYFHTCQVVKINMSLICTVGPNRLNWLLELFLRPQYIKF